MTWAFGKAILLGEHAVVYGHPALAGAIDCPLRCRLERPGAVGSAVGDDNGAVGSAAMGTNVRVQVPAWDVDVSSTDQHIVAQAVRALLAALDITALSAHIVVDTLLPRAAGLGSSAAFAVGLVRTLGQAVGRVLSAEDIERAADAAERCFHANPSGVDVALATRGGLGLYRRGHGLEPVTAPPVTVVVGLSGHPRRTADMVERVAAERQRDPAGTDARLAALGQAALAGAAALGHGDRAALGALMCRAHGILAELGVSVPALDELARAAMEAGALGAKLTGAGGGGAVIAVADGREQAVLAAWRARGYHGFVCRVGATPAAGASS